jgi:HEAT repeat protein
LLASRPADQALATINTAVEQDADKQVRRQAVSSLARLPDGAGLPRLIELARTHKDQEIRRQAMLALGQSRDPRAIDFLSQILTK